MNSISGGQGRYDPQVLERMEMAISEDVTRERQRAFGDGELEVDESDPRYHQVDAFIEEKVTDYPGAENGDKFVNSYLILIPTLHIDSLQVGENIEFGPLEHTLLGSFTDQDARLKLKNIKEGDVVSKGPTLVGPQQGKKSSNSWMINKFVSTGTADKIRKVADVKFGGFFSKREHPIEQDADTYKIPLQELWMQAKIGYDGSVTLRNGKTFNIRALIGDTPDRPRRWVNFQLSLEVPFIP